MATPMKGKICLVTGATHGIGRETALALAGLGATVVLVGRSSEKTRAAALIIQEKTGNPHIDYLVADLSSFGQVYHLVDEFHRRYEHLHVLVNNAGGVFFRRQLSADGLEMTLALNHLSPFLLTHLLLDTLKSSAPARIITVSSLAHAYSRIHFNDLQLTRHYNGWVAYGQSKLANILFTYELARRLEGSQVTANTVHPGYVVSNFGMNNNWFFRLVFNAGRLFAISTQKGAETITYLASSGEVAGVNGKYFVNKRPRRSSKKSYDTHLAARLWQISRMMTGLDGKRFPQALNSP
jgi:NAD(P)-dependent dehydrogenase (short-subunit alcohol dehydrogenase family)